MRHSVEATLAGLAVRQTTANRRTLWAVLLVALPVVVALLTRDGTATDAERIAGYAENFSLLVVPVLLPLVALVVGTGVFGNEVDDGTITYVLGKPVARWRIVLVRTLTAGALAAAVAAPATALQGLIEVGSAGARTILAFTGAVVAGSFLYCALFVALSLSTRRALIAGLAYVVIWEGALASNLAGTRALSIRQYTLAFADALAGAPVLEARLGLSTALWMAAVVGVLATLHAIRRLRRFEIGEAV